MYFIKLLGTVFKDKNTSSRYQVSMSIKLWLPKSGKYSQIGPNLALLHTITVRRKMSLKWSVNSNPFYLIQWLNLSWNVFKDKCGDNLIHQDNETIPFLENSCHFINKLECYATDLTLKFGFCFSFPLCLIFQFSYLLSCTTMPANLQARGCRPRDCNKG